MDQNMFLDEPPATEAGKIAYAEDRDADGYVWNVTRLWCWRPEFADAFAELRKTLTEPSTLSERDLAVLVTSTAAELNDSYCSFAWGPRLAKLSDDVTAAQVIGGAPAPNLTAREAALAAWARQVVRDPNATTPDDVDALRGAGLDDREIFEATAFIALRLAFSTVNDALGAVPDQQLAAAAPDGIRAAVGYGRAPAQKPSSP